MIYYKLHEPEFLEEAMKNDQPICQLVTLLGIAALIGFISTFIFANRVAAMEGKIAKLEQQRGVPIDGKELKPGVYELGSGQNFIAVEDRQIKKYRYYFLPEPQLERHLVHQVMFPKKDEPNWKLYYLDQEGKRGKAVKLTDFQYIDLKVLRMVREKRNHWSLNDQIIIIPSKPKALPIVYTLDSDVP